MLNIVALRYISFSEINKFKPEVNEEWVNQNLDAFHKILWDLGLDTKIPYDYQRMIPHRNFFNEVVICDRVVGNSRLDKEWLESGLASVEAKDKALNSKLLVDLYKMKGMVESE